MTRSLLKILGIALYIFLLLLVSGKLFFESAFDGFLDSLKSRFSVSRAAILTIGFSEPFISLHPLASDVGSRARLLHLYEGLVQMNADLEIEPGLAVSYGSLDDFTWEFRLRPGVFFHDGKPLIMDDVIFSLRQAKENQVSDLQGLASTIKEIKKIDEQMLHIITDAPDPLLLQKLASFLIFPKNATLEKPIGTGPYEWVSEKAGTVTIKRFEKYWGRAKKNSFSSVVLKTFGSRQEKFEALKNRSVDIVANVPPDLGADFNFRGMRLLTRPSLEVNFLMFHFDKTFRSRALREAVSLAVAPEEVTKLVQGFAMPAEQFVGNGIFGYDPSIPKRTLDLKRAEELVKSVSNFSRVKAMLSLPKGLDAFGSFMRERLKKIGIDLSLEFLFLPELGKKITKREAEFFFFGWRMELGDASDFLTAVAHSPSGKFGQFNGGNYRSGEADRFIELSQETLKADRRLEYLRAAMKKITVEDIIGVPLFSPEVLYGVSTKLQWKPRVDGYILAQEMKI